jgi:hypothetical protein
VGSYVVTYNVTDGAGNPAVEVMRTVVVIDGSVDVTVLDEWVVDGSYAAQNAIFDVSAGTNRIVLVGLSAEKNQNGPMAVASVSLGGQALTELFDFTVGSSSAYHNLHWLGYLLESEIVAAGSDPVLTITYANAPSNPFDEPKIHFASYANVDQITPIVDSDSNSNTNASSLMLTHTLIAGDGDKIVGFNVVGQNYAPGLITFGYTEETESIGATNGHASAVYDRTATTSVTENPTFTSATATRMAVSAVVLKSAGGENAPPVLGNNTLTIDEGATVVLTAANLSATDADTDDSTLTFTVSSVANGQFEFVGTAGMIMSFTQAELTAPGVQFVHNGSELAPSYFVSVDDGTQTDGPAAAAIIFTNVDIEAPEPDPITWAVVPHSTGTASISMTASTASDPSGVEYLFTNTAGGGNNSGWQDSPIFEDTGLQPNTSYTYTVTARDKSANQNATAASTTESATTDALLPDTSPPNPDPMTWVTTPNATGSTSINMVASTATDPSGVEYYFEETSGNPGGTDSAWQTSPNYTDSGLSADTEYSYRVKARDKSADQNETNWSSTLSATSDKSGCGAAPMTRESGQTNLPAMNSFEKALLPLFPSIAALVLWNFYRVVRRRKNRITPGNNDSQTP